MSFKFVNVEIYVLIPIIAHQNEYPGTRPLKLLPTQSHITGNIENTNSILRNHFTMLTGVSILVGNIVMVLNCTFSFTHVLGIL